MEISQLAVPGVYVLIFFLGYPSQWLLMHLEPAPLTKKELIASNAIVILILITYTKSVFVDPGTIPPDWAEKQEHGVSDEKKEVARKSRKWCRKCDAPKPPRAHHCKSCKRCIPKMDHHCPWTANCVSHTTLPHFQRFLLSSTLGLSLLQSFLLTRLYHLWTQRDLPSYLGPSAFLLFHLFALLAINSLTLFALGILCIRNLWCMAVNTTTIEGWEIERHRTLLRRARVFGGYLDTPDGVSMRIKKQEFPYDIGVWSNIAQGMGTRNPLQWLNPFAPTPSIASGLVFETNGFEDPDAVWPPPDPDRAYKRHARAEKGDAFVFQDARMAMSDRETVEAFRKRQDEDVVRRRRPFVDRLEESVKGDGDEEYEYDGNASEEEEGEGEGEKEKYADGEGEEGWRNSEGERLKDFGVDEDVEFYDEQDDEIPLAQLIARRRAAAS
jgi:palmitoyltransferase